MDTHKPGPLRTSISIEYGQGICDAFEHLYTLNHRRIAFISGPLGLQSARERQNAFVSCLKKKRLPAHRQLIVKGNHRIEGGMLAMWRWLKLRRRPNAV